MYQCTKSYCQKGNKQVISLRLFVVVYKLVIIITQMAAIALEPLTTHPDEWAEPSHK